MESKPRVQVPVTDITPSKKYKFTPPPSRPATPLLRKPPVAETRLALHREARHALGAQRGEIFCKVFLCLGCYHKKYPRPGGLQKRIPQGPGGRQPEIRVRWSRSAEGPLLGHRELTSLLMSTWQRASCPLTLSGALIPFTRAPRP